MINFMRIVLFVFFALKALSAPHPLTSSSIINDLKNSTALSQFGFYLNYVPYNWSYQNNIDHNEFIIEIGPDKKSVLTFKIEKLKAKNIQKETYVKKYLKDYNHYGFEITNLKSSSNLIEVALTQKNKTTKTIQFFVFNNDQLLTATCVDNVINFEQVKKQCEQVIQNLHWY